MGEEGNVYGIFGERARKGGTTRKEKNIKIDVMT
jgi:hypothetical protein